MLKGAPSIVTAVSARAVASRSQMLRPPSPVLKSARSHVIGYLATVGQETGELPPLTVDSPGFQVGRAKIGLGSSSATTVAACGFLFEWAGLNIDSNRDNLMDLAIKAHRAAQGGKGSGADVAAAVHGGTLVFSNGRLQDKISISCVEIVPVWSGRAASTTKLIESTETLRQENPAEYRRCFNDLTRVAEQMIGACRAHDTSAVIEATREYGSLMGKLGDRASSPIVTKEHARISDLARQAGGAAKPSGAGGGDVAIGVFAGRDQSASFRDLVEKSGFRVLDITPGAEGVRREST